MEHIHHKLVTVRPNDKLWYGNNLRKLLRKKRRAHQTAKCKKTNFYWQKFKIIRNKYNYECKKWNCNMMKKL